MFMFVHQGFEEVNKPEEEQAQGLLDQQTVLRSIARTIAVVRVHTIPLAIKHDMLMSRFTLPSWR